MNFDSLYWFLARTLGPLVWGGGPLNRESLPAEYPVVFVCNHAAALGPIAAISSLPVRVYPWVISDMMEKDKAAAYLCRDFVEPQLHVPPPISMMVSGLISRFSIRLLLAMECVPVWHGEGLLETYRLSLRTLVQGKSLLIFPENPARSMDELYRMTPFEKSFARLGETYFEQTKKSLPFYPLAVHSVARKIRIGKPVLYHPHNDLVRERIRIKRLIETTIHDLYLNITLESITSIPIPH